jgi:hypothetical protein
MNFLEQLAAEWYQYRGYFVRTNIRFGRNANGRGGHVGEIDVIAYRPETGEFIHLEASTDSLTWEDRKERFERKFSDARNYYMEIFPFKEIDTRPRQIALVGFHVNPHPSTETWRSRPPANAVLGELPIEVQSIRSFIREIQAELRQHDPQREAVPETFPLLRAIQYSAFLGV